jgi:hypothetical protein
MIGVLLPVWILPLRKLVLLRLLSVSPLVPPLGGLLILFPSSDGSDVYMTELTMQDYKDKLLLLLSTR